MTQNIQWTKPVCQLDADHLYIGQTTADLDIMARDGSYLIPAGCIDTDPPQISAGKAARWNGEGWDVIEDHRGKTAYRPCADCPNRHHLSRLHQLGYIDCRLHQRLGMD